MMKLLRFTIRLIIFLPWVFGYLLEGLLASLIQKEPILRKRAFTRITSFYCYWALRTIHISVKLVNPPPEDKNFLFVCNHMGFLDILCLSSKINSVYITSVEMQKTPFLGLLCEMGGCIFIERRNRENIKKEIEVVSKTLREGFHVTLYPEGTSGDGTHVMPFKKSFLVASYNTQANVKPIVINYKVDGEPLTSKSRDSVCWYGDMTFVESIYHLLGAKKIEAELQFFDEINVDSPDDRRVVAEQAHEIISKHFVPVR